MKLDFHFFLTNWAKKTTSARVSSSAVFWMDDTENTVAVGNDGNPHPQLPLKLAAITEDRSTGEESVRGAWLLMHDSLLLNTGGPCNGMERWLLPQDILKFHNNASTSAPITAQPWERLESARKQFSQRKPLESRTDCHTLHIEE